MKTSKYSAVLLSLTAGLFLFTAGTYAQKGKVDRREQKAIREAQIRANYVVVDSLLSSRSFVLEADYLSNRYGDRVIVTPSLNFIKLQDTNGILQTGTVTGMGFNGVGGVTAAGSIGKWELTRDEKNHSFRLKFSLFTNIGHYDINMVVNANLRATATISGLGPGSLTWEGHLNTVSNSRVYKGWETI